MDIRRVVPDIATSRMAESRRFYADFLGMRVAMDMGWIVTLVSASNPTAQVTLLENPAPPPAHVNLSLSIEVADVDALHASAAKHGVEVVYPLTTEPWGVRRFFVKDPNGVILNLMRHVD